MSTNSGLGSLRDKDGNSLLHIYCSQTFQADLTKFLKRKDFPSQHKNFVKSLRQDDQWILKKYLVEGLITRGCDPNAVNNRGETPLMHLWEAYKRWVKVSKGHSGSCPPGNRERAAMSLLREHGAVADKQMTQDILQVSWSQVLGFRQMGKHGPVLDPGLIFEWTPFRHLFMCNGKVQAEILHGLISGLLARPPSDPVLTLDFIHAATGIINPDATQGGLLLSMLQAVHHMIEDNPKGAHAFFAPRRDAMQLIFRTLMGDDSSEAVNIRDNKTGRTPLHCAVSIANMDTVEILLSHPRIDVSIVDEECHTPLTMLLNELKRVQWLSAGTSKLTAVKALVTRSGRFDQVGRDGSTPLLMTINLLIGCGRPYKERQAYNIMSHHLDSHKNVPVGRESSAILHCIELDRPEILREILDQRLPSLNVHTKDEDGMNVLHAAGLQGRFECARELISSYPSLCNSQDINGNTPLYYLVTSVRPGDTLALLRNFQTNWDFTITNNRYETVLDYYRFKADDIVQSTGIEEVLHSLVSAAGGGNSSSNALISNLRTDPKLVQSMSVATGRRYSQEEAERNLREYVRDLFAIQDVYQSIVNGSRLTANVSLHSKTAPMILALNGLVEELKYLMDNCDIDLNAQDADGKTALHMAAASGNTDCVHAIIRDARVDLDLQDKKGNSGLFYVVEAFTVDEAHILVRQYDWNFRVKNYSNKNAADYYLSCVTNPDETLTNTLRRKCGMSSTIDRNDQEIPSKSDMSEFKARKADMFPVSPSEKIKDEALRQKRPSVGQLTNHLEGLLRKPRQGSTFLAKSGVAGSPPGDQRFFPAKNRVKSFSYLENETTRRGEPQIEPSRSSYPPRPAHKSFHDSPTSMVHRASYSGSGGSDSPRGLARTPLEEFVGKERPSGEGPPAYSVVPSSSGRQDDFGRRRTDSARGYGQPKPPLAHR